MKLPKLLRQVKSGRSFTITNRGEAIADLVPSAAARPKDASAAVDRLKDLMQSDPVRSADIKQIIEDGRA